MKKFIIHLLDMFDDRIVGHRWHWLCNYISFSSWWGEEICICSYCQRLKENV